MQSLDASQGIKDEFPNFKGYDPDDESELAKPGVVPCDVATITDEKCGAVLRFEYRTWQGSALPMYAVRYWRVKHPVLDKLMTTKEREYYKKHIALPRQPVGRPGTPPKEQARTIAGHHAVGALSSEEAWNVFLGFAKPETLPEIMPEFTTELHRYFQSVVFSESDSCQTGEERALLRALAKWYGRNLR